MVAKKNWVIYGNSLSALILAERLGSEHYNVILVNPGRSFGGVFGGVPINGHFFDCGMTNFEFELFADPDNAIEKYSPGSKADIGRYVHFVRRYLERFCDVSSLQSLSMMFRGEITEDFIISNRFDVLSLLTEQERTVVIDELDYIISGEQALHPSKKTKSNYDFEQATFEQASRENVGNTLHEALIEPMFKKVLNIDTSEISAVFHRNGWSPLYYPETLRSQFTNKPAELKPTIFHYPTGKHFGFFINKIVDAISVMKNVTIIDSATGAIPDIANKILRTDQGSFSFDSLAWAGDLKTLLPGVSDPTEVKANKRASLDIIFLGIKETGVNKDFSVIIDPEAVSPFYRVTNQSKCRGTAESTNLITLECNSENMREKSDGYWDGYNEHLLRYGLDPSQIEFWEHKSFKNALAIPSVQGSIEFDATQTEIKKLYPEIYLMGQSSGYVSTTLNDHVIQALIIAKRSGEDV